MAARKMEVWSDAAIDALEHDGSVVSAGVRRGKPKIIQYTGPDGCTVILTGHSKRLAVRYTDVDGTQKMQALGIWPRIRADAALEACRTIIGKVASEKLHKRLTGNKSDKGRVRVASDDMPTFEKVAKAAFKKLQKGWKPGSRTPSEWWRRVSTFAFPSLRAMSINAISTRDISTILEPIGEKNANTAGKLKGDISQIFAYAVSAGYVTNNPVVAISSRMLIGKQETENHKSLPFERAPEVYARIGEVNAKGADCLQFIMLTGLRSSEVFKLQWSDIDWQSATLLLPAARMKEEKAHDVPLSDAALAILQHRPRQGDLVFGKERVRDCMRRSGVQANESDVHGLRATFSTWQQAQGVPFGVREASLAHSASGGDQVADAYGRYGYLEERRIVIQQWGRYLTTP